MPLLTAQRRDGNETEIVNALRHLGCLVIYMDKSSGFDLLVAYRGLLFAMEVKQRGEKLTPRENDLREKLAQHDAPYHVVHDVDEALSVMGW